MFVYSLVKGEKGNMYGFCLRNHTCSVVWLDTAMCLLVLPAIGA